MHDLIETLGWTLNVTIKALLLLTVLVLTYVLFIVYTSIYTLLLGASGDLPVGHSPRHSHSEDDLGLDGHGQGFVYVL
jgi:hypothetical protein